MNQDHERLTNALLRLAKITCLHREAVEFLEQNVEAEESLHELKKLGAQFAKLQSQLAANYSKKCAGEHPG